MVLRNPEYARSVIFGIEDSLVSTTGLVAGLSVGSADRRIVILGGAVAIAIEALSMGAGEYLAEDAVHEVDGRKIHKDKPQVSGLLMFASYILAGLVPLSPVVFLGYPGSVYISVLVALLGLFFLGFIKGKVLSTNPLRGGFKILVVGGLATFIGVAVGMLFKI